MQGELKILAWAFEGRDLPLFCEETGVFPFALNFIGFILSATANPNQVVAPDGSHGRAFCDFGGKLFCGETRAVEVLLTRVLRETLSRGEVMAQKVLIERGVMTYSSAGA